MDKKLEQLKAMNLSSEEVAKEALQYTCSYFEDQYSAEDLQMVKTRMEVFNDLYTPEGQSPASRAWGMENILGIPRVAPMSGLNIRKRLPIEKFFEKFEQVQKFILN